VKRSDFLRRALGVAVLPIFGPLLKHLPSSPVTTVTSTFDSINGWYPQKITFSATQEWYHLHGLVKVGDVLQWRGEHIRLTRDITAPWADTKTFEFVRA
jgi:hypothetical protein